MVEASENRWKWTEAHASPLALRVYLALVSGLWLLSALPLLLRTQRLWSAEPLWHYPPFGDFGWYYERMKLVHTPEFWTKPGAVWTYPAPSALVYQLFYSFNRGSGGPHKVFFGFLAYLTFTAIALSFAGLCLGVALRRRGLRWSFVVPFLAVSLVACWPVFFSMQRGNIEFFLDAWIAAGVWAYVRRRWWIFALLVGIFGSAKLYPLLLLSLLLPLRRWKEFAGGLFAAGVVTGFATWWLGPVPATGARQSIGMIHTLSNWVRANSLVYDPYVLGLDHSVFGFLKRVTSGHPRQLVYWAAAYATISAVGMLILFFGRAWRLPRPNQLLLVSLAAVLLPLTSFDYTLTLLLPVWAWIALRTADSSPKRDQSRGMILAMALFALLFAPETFAGFHGVFFAGQVKMFCLLALLAMSVLLPLSEKGDMVPSAV
jgi:hypothetical protein